MLFAILLSSCFGTYTNKTMRTGTLMPNMVRLDLTLDDFELLGEMEVSVQFHRYIGIFNIINQINEEPFDRRHRNSVSLYGHRNIPLYNGVIREALYKVHVKIPDADFVVPVNFISETDKMFLGRKVKGVLKVKAYKIKDS